MKIKLIGTLIIIMIMMKPAAVAASATIWDIQSIDTMKFSRDAARDPKVQSFIPIHVKAVSEAGANYIAISTPYDDEFIPILTLWVNEARKNNLKIWFRGNFAGWEGWFEYPKLKSYQEHIQKTKRFITNNSHLFQDGDIFTPAPEPENGILGDPRESQDTKTFNSFLVDSFVSCDAAFQSIQKKVNCGIWSFNTDVLKETVEKDTIQKMGGIVGIDHYMKDPQQVITDAIAVGKQFDAKIVLGEFGAPIPDINGAMTEDQQASYIKTILESGFDKSQSIIGLNYWVLAGGSTALLNENNSPRKALGVFKPYFIPTIVTGKIVNPFNEPIKDATIKIVGTNLLTKTNFKGEYSLAYPKRVINLEIGKSNHASITQKVDYTEKEKVIMNKTLEPISPSLWYKIRLYLKNLF